jgi:hypothetical protein
MKRRKERREAIADAQTKSAKARYEDNKDRG